MIRTTILAPQELLLALRSVAQRQGVSFSETIRRALENYVQGHAKGKARISCVGAGGSGGLHLSERHEEMLFDRKA